MTSESTHRDFYLSESFAASYHSFQRHPKLPKRSCSPSLFLPFLSFWLVDRKKRRPPPRFCLISELHQRLCDDELSKASAIQSEGLPRPIAVLKLILSLQR